MDGLALVDTMGATSIHAMQFFVRTMKNRFPDIPLKLISTWTLVWVLLTRSWRSPRV